MLMAVKKEGIIQAAANGRLDSAGTAKTPATGKGKPPMSKAAMRRAVAKNEGQTGGIFHEAFLTGPAGHFPHDPWRRL